VTLEASADRDGAAGDLLGGATRRRITLGRSGVEIALLDWGGEGPLALLHHANGFCAALWAPIAERLRERFHVVAMDARGHGDSSLPAEGISEESFGWGVLAGDVSEVAHTLLRETGESSLALGIGHSFGGTLLLTAAASEPALFDRLLLLDPILLPPMTKAQAAERAADNGLAARARRRRHEWPSRGDAHAFFAERPLFAAWRPPALDLYIAEGLRDVEGGGVELKCSGAAEAQVFEGPHTLDVLGRAKGVETPILLLGAERGDIPHDVYRALVADLADARFESVDSGHLIPMEHPEIVLQHVEDFCP